MLYALREGSLHCGLIWNNYNCREVFFQVRSLSLIKPMEMPHFLVIAKVCFKLR